MTAKAKRKPERAAVKVARVEVRVKPRPVDPYRVLIGAGLLADGAALAALDPTPRAVVVVIDGGLPRMMIEPVIRDLDRAKVRWGVCVATPTEADKSVATLERVLVEAGRLRLERGDAIFAVGGGIVCDLAGLAGALYRRGVRVVQCPTTLLAMVDAAVGGKTAANLHVPSEDAVDHKPRLVKNLIGCFHQPAAVIADVATLRTLPSRELRAGLAECLKHGLIGGGAGDAKLLAWTEANLTAILGLDPQRLSELVRRNVALKAKVVASDPYETSTSVDGGRMALNLGHTFAHAIETLPGLNWTRVGSGGGTGVQVGPLKHGEAVGLGLIAAAQTAAALKIAPKGLTERVRTLVGAAGLPTAVEGLPPSERLIERMMDDKKVAGGRLRLILPTGAGRVKVVTDPAKTAVESGFGAIRGL